MHKPNLRKQFDRIAAELEWEFKDYPDIAKKAIAICNRVIFTYENTDDYFANIHQLQFHVTRAFSLPPGVIRTTTKDKQVKLIQHLFINEAKRIFGTRYTLKEIAGHAGVGNDHSKVIKSVAMFDSLFKDILSDKKNIAAAKLTWEQYVQERIKVLPVQ